MNYISYAQKFEDLIIWNALRDVKNGFYVDIGANDPIKFSVTKNFYEKGWNGINIEPLPTCYNELVNDRTRDININCAVSNQSGMIEYYETFPDNMFSTFDKSIIPEYIKQGMAFTTRTVQVNTLNQILDLYKNKFTEIHFLKIDVEGFEEQVIQGFDLCKYRPWIIIIEVSISKDFTYLNKVVSSDYVLAFSDDQNYYYLAKEHIDLLTRFNEDITSKYSIYIVRDMNAYRQEISNIHNSYINSISWKITKPLRLMRKIIKNIRI